MFSSIIESSLDVDLRGTTLLGSEIPFNIENSPVHQEKQSSKEQNDSEILANITVDSSTVETDKITGIKTTNVMYSKKIESSSTVKDPEQTTKYIMSKKIHKMSPKVSTKEPKQLLSNGMSLLLSPFVTIFMTFIACSS